MSQANTQPSQRADGGTDYSLLDRSLAKGMAWTGGMKTGTQLLSWVSTLIIARILTPEDYGIMGMALVYLGLVRLVNRFGVGAAIVQRKTLTDQQIRNLATFSLTIGLVFLGASLAIAPLIAGFFDEPAVTGVIAVLATSFIPAGLRVISSSLLNRDLEFRKLAWIDGIQAITQVAITLVLALLGYGYWSLVFGSLAAEVATTVTAYKYRPFRLAIPLRPRVIVPEIRFGLNVVVSQVAWYVYSNADFAIVGRVLGAVSLGVYTIGWRLASVPVEKVTALLARVTRVIFAKVQDDTAALQRYLRLLTAGISLVTFPLAIGLSLVADDLILFAIGDRWAAAILPLRILALYAGVRSIGAVFPQVLVATDRTALHARFSIIGAIILPVLFFIGARWGTVGVASAWLVGYPLLLVPLYARRTLRLIRMSPWHYLGALWPAASSCALMAVAVIGIRFALPAVWPSGLRLAAQAGAGVVVYSLAVFMLHREWTRRTVTFFRALRGSPKTDEAVPIAAEA